MAEGWVDQMLTKAYSYSKLPEPNPEEEKHIKLMVLNCLMIMVHFRLLQNLDNIPKALKDSAPEHKSKIL